MTLPWGREGREVEKVKKNEKPHRLSIMSNYEYLKVLILTTSQSMFSLKVG